MSSSPVPSSWLQETPDSPSTPVAQAREQFDPADADVPTKHVLLVREEELDEVMRAMHSVLWLHVYSLQRAGPGDMHVLGVVAEKVNREYVRAMGKDPVAPLRGLGVIENPHVRWREVKNALALAGAAAAPKVAPGTAAASKPPPVLSRESSGAKKGSIMSSFAKTQPKTAGKVEAKSTATKTAPAKESPKPKDEPNFSEDDDDDEEEEAIDAAALEAAAEKAAAARKDKAARTAKLKAMMDDDDDSDTEMQDAPAAAADAPAEPMEEDEEVVDTSGALDAPVPAQKPQESVTVDGGRRRGRRQVRKKRTYTDEEGYLVTKEEMEWESFSEEDDAAKLEAKKIKTLPALAKKKAGAPGAKQGNIMAFFGKR